jgi:hypothetical protein
MAGIAPDQNVADSFYVTWDEHLHHQCLLIRCRLTHSRPGAAAVHVAELNSIRYKGRTHTSAA